MIDFETFTKELSSIRNDLSEITVGNFSGYTHVAKTPAHTFQYIDLYVSEIGFLHIVARDSYRKDMLSQLISVFERTKIKRYKKDILYVYSAYEIDGFDSAGLAPPPLAQAYDSESKILAKSGFQLFPMHGIEFLHKFSESQFWTQRRRQDKWRVNILDWNRCIEIKGTAPNK